MKNVILPAAIAAIVAFLVPLKGQHELDKRVSSVGDRVSGVESGLIDVRLQLDRLEHSTATIAKNTIEGRTVLCSLNEQLKKDASEVKEMEADDIVIKADVLKDGLQSINEGGLGRSAACECNCDCPSLEQFKETVRAVLREEGMSTVISGGGTKQPAADIRGLSAYEVKDLVSLDAKSKQDFSGLMVRSFQAGLNVLGPGVVVERNLSNPSDMRLHINYKPNAIRQTYTPPIQQSNQVQRMSMQSGSPPDVTEITIGWRDGCEPCERAKREIAAKYQPLGCKVLYQKLAQTEEAPFIKVCANGRCVSRRGFTTLGDFDIWFDSQISSP